jgi:hypothetical protein
VIGINRVVGAGLRPARRPRKRRRAIKNVEPTSSRLRMWVTGHEFTRAVTNERHAGLQPLGLQSQIVKLPNRNESITTRINTHRAAINSTQSQPSEIFPKATHNQTGLRLADHSRRRNLRNFLLRLFLFALCCVFASHARYNATTHIRIKIRTYFAFFFVAFGFSPLTYS